MRVFVCARARPCHRPCARDARPCHRTPHARVRGTMKRYAGTSIASYFLRSSHEERRKKAAMEVPAAPAVVTQRPPMPICALAGLSARSVRAHAPHPYADSAAVAPLPCQHSISRARERTRPRRSRARATGHCCRASLGAARRSAAEHAMACSTRRGGGPFGRGWHVVCWGGRPCGARRATSSPQGRLVSFCGLSPPRRRFDPITVQDWPGHGAALGCDSVVTTQV